MTFIERIELFFKTLFTDAEKDAVAFFHAAIDTASQQLGTVGLEIVKDAVTAAETKGGTDAEKLAAALALIIPDLAIKGIVAAKNTINAAITAAVAQQRINDAQHPTQAGQPNGGST